MPAHHSTLFLLAAAALFAAAGAAHAQAGEGGPEGAAADAAPPVGTAPASPVTGNVGLATEYRYRGISQSRFSPALQGGVDWTHPGGFYAGAWGSTIRWIRDAGGDAPVELDLYGGIRGRAWGDALGWDVGLLRYQYPRNRLATSANTTEAYGALTWSVATLKYSHSTTNLFGFEGSRGSGYLDLSATLDLGGGFALVPHVGHQRVRGHGEASYTDWALMLSKDLGHGISATLTALGTDAARSAYAAPDGRFTGRRALVAGVKYAF